MKTVAKFSLILASVTGFAEGADPIAVEEVVVEGRRVNLVGEAVSASQGEISQEEIKLRPLLRTGEVLELVPGMVVTQHSGTGKANQYFMRGFNLDHGTEFSTTVDGMPVNMRSHGHGQGYTDLNFLIPETISNIKYKKGPYYADVGDFSGVGSAEMQTANEFDQGTVELTLGEYDYSRLLATNSVSSESGQWLYGLEANFNNGPWTDIEEDMEKLNLILKHAREVSGGTLQFTLMAYDNQWNSADQIPQRAVEAGIIDDFGSIDTRVGGESNRYSFSTLWSNGAFEVSAYAVQYDMTLWSNFTYFLDDENRGDQFEQVDERWIYGGRASYLMKDTIAGKSTINKFGTELRYDAVDEVGLYHTAARQRLGAVRSDELDEFSIGLYWENQIFWSSALRTVFGLRYDYYDFDVASRIPMNSEGVDLSVNGGQSDDSQLSAKASLIYTINEQWETYLSAGQGFHSNDARGATIQVDPLSGVNVAQVDPLVASFGYEAGLRGFWHERLNTSIALWQLDLDSELLFVGDAGTTEPSRESRRRGVEITAYYRLTDDWTLDLEYAHTDAEFVGNDAGGNHVPGAINDVLQTGISADFDNGWFGSARLRYFGERTLVEDGSITSDPSTVVNLRAGYHFASWTLTADLLNALDSDDHDIDYYYESRLTTEPSGAGIEDIHYHILEPRTLRISLALEY